MKAFLLALAATAALGLAACSGGDGEATATGPLTLEQRVVTEEDAPGSKPDPVEKRQVAPDRQTFADTMGDAFVNPTDEEKAKLGTIGFVQAIRDTRFFGDTHSRDALHTFSLVIQFDSPDAAKEMADFFHTDGVRPCPESCAFQVSEFDVAGIPGATGVRRVATEEDIKAAGTGENRPHDSYAIQYADGDFAYRIELGGLPGEPSQDKAVEIATALYERVYGRPTAS